MRTPTHLSPADWARVTTHVEKLLAALRELADKQQQIHEDLNSFVRAPGQDRDDKREPVSNQDQAAESTERILPPTTRIRTEAELVGKIVEDHNTNQKKGATLQKLGLCVGIATLVAIVAYAFVSFGQLRTMNETYIEVHKQTKAAIDGAVTAQDALKEVRANFIKDQRPWILMNAILPEPNTRRDVQGHFAVGFPLLWRVCYSNYGRSPAIKVIGNARLFHGPNAPKDGDRYFKDLPGRLSGPSTVLPPGGPPAPQSILPGEPPIQLGQGFSTINTETLSAGAIAFIYSHDFAIVAVGRFQYEDVSGNLYWTDFCRSTFLTGAINYCQQHNEIH